MDTNQIAPEETSRWMAVCINKIRRALDVGRLDFDSPRASEESRTLDPTELDGNSPSNEEQMRRYLKHLAYWKAFRLDHVAAVGAVVDFEVDSAYLCVLSSDLKLSIGALARLGWIEPSRVSVSGIRPTTKLIEAYEKGTIDSFSGAYRGEVVTHIYNIYGSQSRVNVGSTDNSTSISTVTSEQLFSQIRETISKSDSPDSEKSQLLAKLRDLETAKGSGGFTEKYQNFIAAAANHMTLLAPFIPALTQMLSGK